MGIGRFDEGDSGREDTENMNDLEGMDDPEGMDEAEDIDDIEDSESEMDETVEDADIDEEAENDSEEQSAFDKLKDKFSSLFDQLKKNETEEADVEDVDEPVGETSETGDENEEKSNPWAVDISQEKQAEIAKEYRDSHNLDEHGESMGESTDNNADTDADPDAKNHGEDGERTRYSDHEAEMHSRYERDDER